MKFFTIYWAQLIFEVILLPPTVITTSLFLLGPIYRPQHHRLSITFSLGLDLIHPQRPFLLTFNDMTSLTLLSGDLFLPAERLIVLCFRLIPYYKSLHLILGPSISRIAMLVSLDMTSTFLNTTSMHTSNTISSLFAHLYSLYFSQYSQPTLILFNYH